MHRTPTSNRWLIPVFLTGIGLGGFAGWQAARHSGFEADRTHDSGATGAVATGNAAIGPPPPSARPGSPVAKFTSSGDPSADFRRILRLNDVASRTGALRQLLTSMPPEGIVKLMAALNQYGRDQEEKDQMGGLLALMASHEIVAEHASSNDPAAVLSALSAAGHGVRNGDFYTDVLRGWAARDPDAARVFFEQNILHAKGVDAKSVAGALVRELVKTDPEGAFRWLRGLKADFTDDVAHDALQTLSHYDAVKAGQLLAQNNDLKKAPEFVAAMTAGWARTEPDKALRWALELPSNIAAGGIKTAVGAWAEKDFSSALTTVTTLQGAQRAAALDGLSSAAGKEHLKELVPLVEGLPESSDRTSAVGTLVNVWVDKSPEEASAWLAAQPAGASRDQGAIVLALKMMDSEPESAMEWISSVNAKDQRQEGLDGLVNAWLQKDPGAARAWVRQSPRLSEAERSRLLERTGR